MGGRRAAPEEVPFGPIEARLGEIMDDPVSGAIMGLGLKWEEAVTENPSVGATEVWAIYNLTMDAHRIHVHEVHFEVVNRQRFDMATGVLDPVQPPPAWENGLKDTVIAFPGEITRIRARFEESGQFVWHCHIVEHEDNEMMRPYRIGPEQPGQPTAHGAMTASGQAVPATASAWRRSRRERKKNR
jgi:FtsP/CotA-like multicopper oxidase with cupredoxin domain